MPNPESEFEWDDEKNLANIRKHGIRFEDAVRILTPDTLGLLARTGDEDRWKAIDWLED